VSNTKTESDTATADKMRELAFGFRKSQVVYVAAVLGIADILEDGPKENAEIAASAEIDARSSLRLMRGLVWCDVVKQEENGCFLLTDMGKYLCKNTPGSEYEYVVGAQEQYPAWGALLHTIQTGETGFNHVFGMGSFDYYTQHPEVGDNFNRRMAAGAKRFAETLIQKYDFSNLTSIVDVGGGNGTLIGEVLKANPHLSGTLFDLPSVIENAPEQLQATGVLDRCALVGGSFFNSVPTGGDIYVLKSILHDWDDEECIKILKCCRNAMGSDNKLLIADQEVPERVDESSAFVIHMDLAMMVTTGGIERTRKEFESLLNESGFQLNRVIPAERLNLFEAIPI